MGIPRKAHSSTLCNFDPDANVTEESDLQEEKQCTPKTSTDAGIIMSTKPV
jgi:hypothetical protein